MAQKTTSSILAGVGITVLASVGGVGDYYLDKDIDLRVTMVTGHEYSQIEPQVMDKLKQNSTQDPVDMRSAMMFGAVLDREVKKCGEIPTESISKNNGGSVKIDLEKLATYVDTNC